MPAATVDHSQRICEVWACSLDEEMKKTPQVIQKYNYVAVDTEFPGVVARPIGEFRSNANYCNLNFKFNLTEDMYAQDSTELLTTCDIQLKKHEEEGIETQYFAELLTTSGVVLCEGVKWLSFHSGYNFGYLIKILTNSNLPEEELDFFNILQFCKNLKGGLQKEMFFEDRIDYAKHYGHLYSLGSGSSYVQNGTGNAYEEEANKQS
uniref:Uncharacterized protein n=1 Tax=Cebus imitator TaxID=2715852 RepID=A0A2K5QB15_CEBIM